jgi:hypothetical protein
MATIEEEGWFQDPYGTHGDRWYSAGRPTSLVRDDGVESTDSPPPGPAPAGPLVASVPLAGPAGAADLLRADEAEQPGPDASYVEDLGSGSGAPDYGEAAFEVGPTGAGPD